MSEVIKEKYEISVWRDIYEMRAGETKAGMKIKLLLFVVIQEMTLRALSILN